MQLQYYIGFVLGFLFLIAAVVLYFVLSIRQIGRYLLKKNKQMPPLLKSTNRPIRGLLPSKKGINQETIIIDDDCSKINQETVIISDQSQEVNEDGKEKA